MKLQELLKYHEGGLAQRCVSIYQRVNEKTHYFFEEEEQGKILVCESYREIAERGVRRFSVIGGGMYPVELYIEIE